MTETFPSFFVPGSAVEASRTGPVIPDHTLLRVVGKGSYGEVWMAKNTLGALRAVKVIYRSSFSESRPFDRELAGIKKFEPVSRSHDGLIDVLQVGQNNDSQYFYYVMELADPEDPHAPLDLYNPRTLQASRLKEGAMPLERSLPIFLSLTSALGHLHAQGLVHRDIKPANIIFVDGLAKLADIGLVADFSNAASYVGTEGFIPPEGPGTPKADIYSLGKLLYEVSTGLDRNEFPRLPIKQDDLQGTQDLLEINAVVLKACATDPRLRYQSANEMHAELALLQSGKSVRKARFLDRRLAMLTRVLVLAGVILALLLGASFMAEKRALTSEAARKIEQDLRTRAEAAERISRDRLAEALLASAKAERRSGQSGRRLKALEYVTNAVALRGPTKELRSEAVAALALPDMQFAGTVNLKKEKAHLLLAAPAENIALYQLNQGTYQICRFDDGSELGRFLYDSSVRCITPGVASNGRVVHMLFSDGATVLWHLDDLAHPTRLPGEIRIRQFADADRFLAATLRNGLMALYDVQSGEQTATFPVTESISELRPFASGPLLAAVTQLDRYGRRKQFSLIDIRDGTVSRVCDLPGDTFAISWASSRDGKWFAIGASDFVIRVWPTTAEGKEFILGRHGAEVVAVAFHPNNHLLATSSWDGTTRVWDVPTREPVFRHSEWFQNLNFVSSGERLVGHRDTFQYQLYDFKTGDLCKEAMEPEPEKDIAQSKGPWVGDYSPDGEWFSSGSWDGVRIWNTKTLKESTMLPLGKSYSSLFFGHPVSLLTTAGSSIRVWPLGAEGLVGEPEVLPLPPLIRDVDFSTTDAARKKVWIGTDNGVIEFLNGTPARSSRLPPFEGVFSASPDGHWLAGLVQSKLCIVDSVTGENRFQFKADNFTQAAFTPDGKSLIAMTETNIVCWDIHQKQQLWRTTWQNSGGGGGRVAISPDGRLAAVALEPRIAGLIDVLSGILITRLEHPDPQPISTVAFNPNGRQLAVVTTSHRIQFWDLHHLRQELHSLGLDW